MPFRIVRAASASWSGTARDGGGRLALGSGAFEGPFTERARVVEGVPGANPEELIGAGVAGCFTMSLADRLSAAGHPPQDLQTTARVHLEETDTGYAITRIALETVASVEGIDLQAFEEAARQAKSCPVSRALAGTEITLVARLS